jgi:hypothetical protein
MDEIEPQQKKPSDVPAPEGFFYAPQSYEGAGSGWQFVSAFTNYPYYKIVLARVIVN